MYNIGICDDGENICTDIEKMLLQYAKEQNIQVDTNVWYSGEGLRDYLDAGNHLDILFLDIELFKMTGIEVGNYIRKQLDDMGMQIVYISGKSSYADELTSGREYAVSKEWDNVNGEAVTISLERV